MQLRVLCFGVLKDGDVRAQLGGVSIVGNLGLMKFMVGLGHMNYLAANAVAIALCSRAHFLVSDEWVFEERS